MASVKGTRTEKNLMASFAGESQARNRYSYAAKVAEKEGYPQIAEIFLETADNERVHAKRMFQYLDGGEVEITATYPAGPVGDTIQNLEAAAAGEHEEQSELYPEFARIAQDEGFGEIAAMYRAICNAESQHEKRFLELLNNVRTGTMFKKEQPVKWRCDKCGYIHEGLEAPNTCPACRHPKKYFQVLAENW